jgi:hypothetical protein
MSIEKGWERLREFFQLFNPYSNYYRYKFGALIFTDFTRFQRYTRLVWACNDFCVTFPMILEEHQKCDSEYPDSLVLASAMYTFKVFEENMFSIDDDENKEILNCLLAISLKDKNMDILSKIPDLFIASKEVPPNNLYGITTSASFQECMAKYSESYPMESPEFKICFSTLISLYGKLNLHDYSNTFANSFFSEKTESLFVAKLFQLIFLQTVTPPFGPIPYVVYVRLALDMVDYLDPEVFKTFIKAWPDDYINILKNVQLEMKDLQIANFFHIRHELEQRRGLPTVFFKPRFSQIQQLDFATHTLDNLPMVLFIAIRIKWKSWSTYPIPTSINPQYFPPNTCWIWQLLLIQWANRDIYRCNCVRKVLRRNEHLPFSLHFLTLRRILVTIIYRNYVDYAQHFHSLQDLQDCILNIVSLPPGSPIFQISDEDMKLFLFACHRTLERDDDGDDDDDDDD